MRPDNYEEILEVPKGITATFEAGNLTVKGAKGELVRSLRDPKITVEAKDNKVVLNAIKPSKRENKQIKTFRAHIRNMFDGATNGVTYTLKICSGHFPMNVSVNGDMFTVKNFLGEKIPRTLKIKPGVSVKVDGDKINVEGIDIERCGNTAAGIEQLMRITNRDRRIFQDGIYVINKNGKAI
jgi:large subunit ribosomal protein L6